MYVHIYTYINVLHIYLQLICLQTLWHNSYLWSRRRRRRRRLVVIASRLAHTAYECSYKKRYAPAKKKKTLGHIVDIYCEKWYVRNGQQRTLINIDSITKPKQKNKPICQRESLGK